MLHIAELLRERFHQDFLLGPTNQLLGGGALMVNVPVSQYGVGYIYLLAGWFHLVPIGYGTYGFLDGLVTALFYVAGYAILRLAGGSPKFSRFHTAMAKRGVTREFAGRLDDWSYTPIDETARAAAMVRQVMRVDRGTL